MPLNPDFSDLFAALNGADARYLLVGGYAVAFHAEPRFTKDLDIWVEPSPANAARVFRALTIFGAPLSEVTEADFGAPGIVFQIGLPPNRIDVVTTADGVEFAEAWQARAQSRYGAQPINIISRQHLIDNKRAMGRPQDLLDVALLERHAQGVPNASSPPPGQGG
jgi:hypothetical protein